MRLVSVVVATLVLAGCASLASPSGRPFPGAPAEVRDRQTLPACGEESTTQDAGFNLDGRRCLWQAYLDGRAAEFISTTPTMEGAPVTRIFRLTGDGRVVVLVDNTQDRWSGMTWVRLECARLALMPDLPGQPAFSAEDCAETILDG